MIDQISTTQTTDRVQLGKTDLYLSPLGIGTWAWGDRLVWGYGGQSYSDADLRAAFDSALDAGINWFDTAELYGFPTHQSEKLLGRFIRESGRPAIVASKFMPAPWRFSATQFFAALDASLKALGLPKIDLYQIHWPFSSLDRWTDAQIKAVQAGLIRAVGVSNYNADQMQHAHDRFAAHNIPLASNQVHYSLLTRNPERNGVLKACKERGISLIAYSPLEMGLLTGKYTPENAPKGIRSRQYSAAYLASIQTLIGHLRSIGAAHGGKSPSQVALNWTICKGTLPIPGAKNIRQAAENNGALGWRLSDAEVALLDSESEKVEK